MSPPFYPYTPDEFAQLAKSFDWNRRIIAVHMHHTWKPAIRDYRGEPTIRGMWEFHTKHNGWSDIAQHVSVAPDGTIWSGRDWNRPPASSGGYNGTSREGPFMFETIGNFDRGADLLQGDQRTAVVTVIGAVQEIHHLDLRTLKFHRMLGSPKSCPGSGLTYDEILREVAAFRQGLALAPILHV